MPTVCALTMLLAAGCVMRPAAARADEPLSQGVLQADGITNHVIDHVWLKTDHYWHLGDYNRIIALIRICVSADPSFTEAYSDGAWLIWSMGDIPAADAFLQDGIERSPNKADINYELGWHLFNTKRYAAAVPYLKRASAGPSPERMSLTTLAHCYRYLHRYDDSIAVWHEVIQKFPDFGAGPTNLARVEALKRGGPPKPTVNP